NDDSLTIGRAVLANVEEMTDAEIFEQVAGVTAGEGSPTDRSGFEHTLGTCIAAAQVDVTRNVLIVGGSFRDAHSLYRTGFRRMTLSNVEPLVDAEGDPCQTQTLSFFMPTWRGSRFPMPAITLCWRTRYCITAARHMPLSSRCCASAAAMSSSWNRMIHSSCGGWYACASLQPMNFRPLSSTITRRVA